MASPALPPLQQHHRSGRSKGQPGEAAEPRRRRSTNARSQEPQGGSREATPISSGATVKRSRKQQPRRMAASSEVAVPELQAHQQQQQLPSAAEQPGQAEADSPSMQPPLQEAPPPAAGPSSKAWGAPQQQEGRGQRQPAPHSSCWQRGQPAGPFAPLYPLIEREHRAAPLRTLAAALLVHGALASAGNARGHAAAWSVTAAFLRSVLASETVKRLQLAAAGYAAAAELALRPAGDLAAAPAAAPPHFPSAAGGSSREGSREVPPPAAPAAVPDQATQAASRSRRLRGEGAAAAPVATATGGPERLTGAKKRKAQPPVEAAVAEEAGGGSRGWGGRRGGGWGGRGRGRGRRGRGRHAAQHHATRGGGAAGHAQRAGPGGVGGEEPQGARGPNLRKRARDAGAAAAAGVFGLAHQQQAQPALAPLPLSCYMLGEDFSTPAGPRSCSPAGEDPGRPHRLAVQQAAGPTKAAVLLMPTQTAGQACLLHCPCHVLLQGRRCRGGACAGGAASPAPPGRAARRTPRPPWTDSTRLGPRLRWPTPSWIWRGPAVRAGAAHTPA